MLPTERWILLAVVVLMVISCKSVQTSPEDPVGLWMEKGTDWGLLITEDWIDEIEGYQREQRNAPYSIVTGDDFNVFQIGGDKPVFFAFRMNGPNEMILGPPVETLPETLDPNRITVLTRAERPDQFRPSN